VLGAAEDLPLQTHFNGDLRQDSRTSDLLFGVRRIFSFLSQGTTLERVSVILTGTTSGVALGMSPPKWLQNGDIIRVTIGGIGRIENKLVFLRKQDQLSYHKYLIIFGAERRTASFGSVGASP
jgi:2-keto-4-pentenoate hydratase/2-oxohepta-3-ene-1,7-dioic acid hydratase in catechol pathway